MKLSFERLLELPQGLDFPRRDVEKYLADHIVRSVMLGDRRSLSDGDEIHAGNGLLVVTVESFQFTPTQSAKLRPVSALRNAEFILMSDEPTDIPHMLGLRANYKIAITKTDETGDCPTSCQQRVIKQKYVKRAKELIDAYKPT